MTAKSPASTAHDQASGGALIKHDSAARRLLDREAPQGYVDERTLHFAAPPGEAEGEARSVLIMRIGCEWLGLPAGVFGEVTEVSALHTLPHRRSGLVRGLVNVRGQLLVCVSLEKLLGLQAVPAGPVQPDRKRRRLLVAGRDELRLVFEVDEVDSVFRYQLHQLRAVPTTLDRSSLCYTTGLLPWRDQMVACLDDELLFSALDRGLA